LSINGQAYTLLYKLTDSTAATGNGTDTGTDDIAGIDNNTAAGAANGYYALATNVTGTGSASAAQFSSAPVTDITGIFEGLGHTITDLTVNGSGGTLGLFGVVSGGTVRDVGIVGGSIAGASTSWAGGLVGEIANMASIVNSYSTAAVSASGGLLGGLVGWERSGASITNSFATGPVSGGTSSYDSSIGGLVGQILTGSVTNSYATGAVSSASTSFIGGLVGENQGGTVSYSYATGAINGTSSSTIGGLVGYNESTVINSYWDTTNSGASSAGGVGPSGTGFTTGQLQGTASLGGSTLTLGSAFAGGAAGTANGGANGEYPYLVSFFPSGVQVIAGTAYQGTGSSSGALASTGEGAGLVSAVSGGALVGSVTTGALGYYYLFVPAGTFAPYQGVVVYTQANGATGAQNAASFAQASSGATFQTMNVYGGWELDQPGSAITTLSGLNSAIATAEGGTAPAGFTLGNRKILISAGSFDIDQSLTLSGIFQPVSTGSVSETNGATITAEGVLLRGSGGSYTLDDANQIATLAAATGSVSLVNTGNLATATLTGADGASWAGITATGSVSVVDTGNVTIAAGNPISAQSPVLAATGAFVNDDGASAVTASTGRWLIYSSAPGADTFGGLNSANTAIFDATYSTLAPGSVTQSGDRYLFANQPALTVTSTNDSKTYGVDDTLSILGDYTITGFPAAAGAFVTDTVSSATSGTPSVTSAGSSAYAPVGSSPYTLTVSAGSLSSSAGYTFNYVSNGQLTVNPATITVAGATGVNKTYDATTTLPSLATGFTESGIYGNDAANVTVSATNAAYASPNAGSEAVDVSGLTLTGSAAGNYVLSATSVTGSGLIGQATITVAGATGINKTYDATTALPSGATGYTFSGVYSTDLGGVTVSAASASYASPNAGAEAVDVSGLTLTGSAAGNYTLSATGVTGSGTIGQATITVAGATGINKTYDTTTALPTGITGFTTSGIFGSDASNVAVSAANAAYAGANAGAQAIDVSGLTLSGSAAGNYALSSTSVTGSGTITPAVLNLAGTRVYDAATDASAAIFGASGTVAGLGGQTLTLSGAGTLAGKNAGQETLATLGTLSLGNGTGLASNYTLTGGTDTVDVTPATITVAGTSGINKTYDTTTALPAGATSFTPSGVFASDAANVTVSAANAAYAGANAGPEAVDVAGLTLSGSAAGNYVLSSTSTTGSGTISTAVLNLAGTRVYDGATDANAAIFGASGTVTGLGGQTLTLAGAGTLAGKNTGSETLSSLGTLRLESGTGLAGNYTLTGGTDSVEVTPATLTVAGATGVNKTYNGSTALPAGATGFTTSGLYGVDAGEVTVTAAHAAYASAASGTEPVLVSGLTLSGSDADDYVLSATSVTGSGTISAAAGHTGSVTLGGLGGGGAGGGGGAADGGAGGSGSFVLSGTVTRAGSTGLPETVIGTLSNGAISISGTFIVESAAGAHPPVADELAASTTDIVVYVPGTLSASVAHPTTAGLASNTDTAAWNEYPTPTDVMPRAYPTAGDWAAPWSIVDALGAQDFAQAFVCIKDSCARTTAR